MAFEVYDFSTSGSSGLVTANNIIDKLIELYEDFFDATDTTSGNHSVTYGDAKLSSCNAGLVLYDSSDTTVFSQSLSTHNYSIVKTANALLLSTSASNGNLPVVFSTTSNIDGTIGKGIIMGNSQASVTIGVVTDNYTSSNMLSDDIRVSNGITQLIPLVTTTGDDIFDNAYRVILGTSYLSKGLYMIGNDRYYISQRTAIKEE